MSALIGPTVRQIAAQVEVVLSHDPGAAAIAIRARLPRDWPARLSVSGRDFCLAWCPSPIAVRRVIGHRLAGRCGHRVHRVEMAMRLARWLARPPGACGMNLGALARAYADDGAFVDWARLALLGGDELAEACRGSGAIGIVRVAGARDDGIPRGARRAGLD